MTVSHQAIVNNWLIPKEVELPKTLVLGSFNPFHINQNSVIIITVEPQIILGGQ